MGVSRTPQPSSEFRTAMMSRKKGLRETDANVSAADVSAADLSTVDLSVSAAEESAYTTPSLSTPNSLIILLAHNNSTST